MQQPGMHTSISSSHKQPLLLPWDGQLHQNVYIGGCWSEHYVRVKGQTGYLGRKDSLSTATLPKTRVWTLCWCCTVLHPAGLTNGIHARDDGTLAWFASCLFSPAVQSACTGLSAICTCPVPILPCSWRACA